MGGVLSSPPHPGDGPDEMVNVTHHLLMMNYQKSGELLDKSILATALRKPHVPYLFSVWAAQKFNSGFMSVLGSAMAFGLLWLVLVYLIGCRVFNPLISLAGVCVLLPQRMTWDLLGHFINDIHVCFFAAAVILLIVCQKKFSHPLKWALLGILVGAGMLSKPTLPIYIVGILIALLIRDLPPVLRSRSAAMIAGFFGKIAGSMALASIVWLSWFRDPLVRIRYLLTEISQGPNVDFNYFHNMAGDNAFGDMLGYLSLPGMLLVVFGFVASLFLWRTSWRKSFLLAALLPPVLLYAAMTEAFTRLMYPVLFMAVFFALDATRIIPKKIAQKAIVATVGIVFLVLFLTGYRNTRYEVSPSARGQVVTPTFAPRPNPGNPVYEALPLVDYMRNHPAPGGNGDLLYLNFCKYKKAEMGPFHLITLLDLPAVDFAHLYNAAKNEIVVGDQLHEINRIENLKMLVVCNDEGVPTPEKIEAGFKKVLRPYSEEGNRDGDFAKSGLFEFRYIHSIDMNSESPYSCQGKCGLHLYYKQFYTEQ